MSYTGSHLKFAGLPCPFRRILQKALSSWHSKEFVHFLLNANGSLKEVETHLLISERLGLLQRPELQTALGLSEELGRMLAALRQKLSH